MLKVKRSKTSKKRQKELSTKGKGQKTKSSKQGRKRQKEQNQKNIELLSTSK